MPRDLEVEPVPHRRAAHVAERAREVMTLAMMLPAHRDTGPIGRLLPHASTPGVVSFDRTCAVAQVGEDSSRAWLQADPLHRGVASDTW